MISWSRKKNELGEDRSEVANLRSKLRRWPDVNKVKCKKSREFWRNGFVEDDGSGKEAVE